MRLTLVLSSIVFAVATAPLPINSAIAAWFSEQDPTLGFAYSYPSDLFDRKEGDGKPSFHYFSSKILRPNC